MSNGYALFVKWQEQRKAEAILFRTKDGGNTWQKLTHPRPVAENQQLYTAGGQTGYFRGGYYPVLNMQNLDWVSALADGTVLGRTNRAGTVYLGQGPEWPGTG